MVSKPTSNDSTASAIAKAEALVQELERFGGNRPGILRKSGNKVPPVRDWRIPVLIALFLFLAQALVAAVVDDNESVAIIFAVGAVTVAVLTGIVAALSYAQQSAIPFADFLAVLKEILTALKKLDSASGDLPPDGGTKTSGAVSQLAPPALPPPD
jgi:hypothetical protein